MNKAPPINKAIATGETPPGPQNTWFGLPLVGEMKKDILGLLQRLHKQYGDIVLLQIANQAIYTLFSPELIREAIVTHADDFVRHERVMDVFSLIYGDNVMTTEADTWKRQRRILTPGFAPKKIAGYTRLMAGATADSFSSALPQVEGTSLTVDVDRFMTKLTMDVILRVLFSYKASEQQSNRIADAVRSLEHQSARELMWPTTPPDWLPYPGRKQKKRDKAILDELIQIQIQIRRRAADEHADKADYLAMLLSAQDQEQDQQQQSGSSASMLNDQEIHDNCAVIFAAGHDTTAAALTWWLGQMTQHPDYADKAREEIQQTIGDREPTPEELMGFTWLNATIKETMRICPSVVSLFNRRAIRDTKLGQWHIPKGATVSVPIWNVHHDERYYPEPDKFQPERFLPGAPKIPRGAYLPFGVGPHICIGQHLALLEMAQICAALLRQFDFEFIDGQSLPKAKVEMLLKPEVPLMIKFCKR